MFIAKSHWSDSRPLVSATPLILVLIGTFFGQPVIALYYEALDLQDLSLNVLKKVIDGLYVWVIQPITLVLVLGSCSVGQPSSSPQLHHQVSSLTLPWLVAVMSKGRGQVSCLQASGPVYPHLHLQGQLYCVAQVRCRGRSCVL